MAKQIKSKASNKPKLARKKHEEELQPLQADLCQLQEWVKHEGERIIIAFEGRDGSISAWRFRKQ